MARVGRPSVPHATAAGKVMLAFTGGGGGGAAGVGGAAGGGRAAGGGGAQGRLTAFTERTITDPAVLAAELAAVRERGYAEAVGEREPDLGALAAPVFGRGGELVAILGIQGPASRLPASKRRALREPLLAAAASSAAPWGDWRKRRGVSVARGVWSTRPTTPDSLMRPQFAAGLAGVRTVTRCAEGVTENVHDHPKRIRARRFG